MFGSDMVGNSSSIFEVLPRTNSMSTSLNNGENYAYLNTMLEGERKKSTELQKRLKVHS